MIPAEEALTRLVDGNKRFVAGVQNFDATASSAKRAELLEGQEPMAIILGCSDSRVPLELVFDQGLGDLFVVRVAGNVVGPTQLESIEFSASAHGAKLVVVLGHSNCAAVAATVAELGKPEEECSKNMRAIIGRIRPALEKLYETKFKDQPEEMHKHAVRENVRACVDHLRNGSSILADLANNQGLMIIGAEYSLETGMVDFF